MSPAEHKARILIVTSGKGGVGKTNIAVNLALSLRLFEMKVLLIDADVGLGNVDVLLGLNPDYDMRDVLMDGLALEEAIIEGPWGLRILPGASGIEEIAALGEDKLTAFLSQIEDYARDMDFVVIDSAPGISPQVINCLMASDEIVLVTNPEPTALTDAYALLKVLNARERGQDRHVSIIVNQTGSKEEAVRSFDRLKNAAKRFLNWEIGYLGSVARDETVAQASRRQVDFLTHYTSSQCSRDVRKIAARLLSMQPEEGASVGRFFESLLEGSENE